MKKFNSKKAATVILMTAFAALMPMLNSCSIDVEDEADTAVVSVSPVRPIKNSEVKSVEIAGTPRTAPETLTVEALEYNEVAVTTGTPRTAPKTAEGIEYSEVAVTTGTPRTAPNTTTIVGLEKKVTEDELQAQLHPEKTEKYINNMKKRQFQKHNPNHYNGADCRDPDFRSGRPEHNTNF